MGAAVDGVDVVGEAEDVLRVGVVVLERDLDRGGVLAPLDVDRPAVQGLLVLVEVADEGDEAALEIERTFSFGSIVQQADPEALVQIGRLTQTLGDLDAGLGYGGSCFPKDVKALIACSKIFGYVPELLESVENLNNSQPLKAVEFCKQQLGKLEGKKIAILGLAFKPNTDDMREARVIPIINQLLTEGATVTAYDPVAVAVAKTLFQNKIQYATTAINCLDGADAAILVTEWEEFKKLTPEDFTNNMKQPVLIDGRRIFDPEKFGKKLRLLAIGLGL